MKIAPLLMVGVSAASCYPLPSPTYSVSRYGLDATLVDATSGKPLRRTETSVIFGSEKFKKRTSEAGTIRIPAKKDHYWTWLGGPIRASFPTADIQVEADGFEPMRIAWTMFDKTPLPTENGRVQAGRMLMKKRSPGRTKGTITTRALGVSLRPSAEMKYPGGDHPGAA
jgi:hypothetical protein